MSNDKKEAIVLTTAVVSSYVGSNSIPSTQLVPLLRDVYGTFIGLAGGNANSGSEQHKPAVSIKKSIAQDYIVCLEDGKKLKMLKRYLRTQYGLSPAEYRAKWGLPADYPMVAPSYSEQRSKFAKQIGLGRVPAKRRGRRKAT